MRPTVPFPRFLLTGLLAGVIGSSLTGCLTFRYPPPPPDAIRPVLAVTSFENRSGYPGEWELGTGMAELLTAELVSCEHFVIVERNDLETLVGEIKRQTVDLFREEGRVAPGQLKNARYQIRGTITDFTHVRGGNVDFALRWVLFGGRGYTARVALNLTIVDIETGEIVHSIQSDGEASAGQAYTVAERSNYDDLAFGGDAFFRTPLGVATRTAIRNGLERILEKVPRNRWRPMIAAISGDTIVLNGGRNRGLRSGARYWVHEPAQPVTDPITGDLITQLPGERVGLIRVRSVEDQAAHAIVVEGSGFARGQSLVSARIGLPPTPREHR